MSYATTEISGHKLRAAPDAIIVFHIPDDCTHVKWNGKEFDLREMDKQGLSKPTTEYEERKGEDGRPQIWKRIPPDGEWERCMPCEETW